MKGFALKPGSASWKLSTLTLSVLLSLQHSAEVSLVFFTLQIVICQEILKVPLTVHWTQRPSTATTGHCLKSPVKQHQVFLTFVCLKNQLFCSLQPPTRPKKMRNCLNKQISQNSSVPLTEEGQTLCSMAPKMGFVNNMNKWKYR